MGKGIESAVLRTILSYLKGQGVKSIIATYIPTAKNGQVSDFYDREGFSLVSTKDNGTKDYSLDLTQDTPSVEPYYTIDYNG